MHNAIHRCGRRDVKQTTATLAAAALSALCALLMSCAQSAPSTRMALQLSSSHPASASFLAETNEQDSVVLRCASIQADGRRVWIEASKSRATAPSNLLFLFPAETGGDGYVCAVAAPITGAEYEYDMAQAKVYCFSFSSAEPAVKQFGLAYQDWLAGAISDAPKFSCCE